MAGALAYDQFENKLVLFGGARFDEYLLQRHLGIRLRDQRLDQGDPRRRFAFVACRRQDGLRPSTGDMVLFGGWDGTSYFNDTWTYNIGHHDLDQHQSHRGSVCA